MIPQWISVFYFAYSAVGADSPARWLDNSLESLQFLASSK
jgi:hypothetical protein